MRKKYFFSYFQFGCYSNLLSEPACCIKLRAHRTNVCMYTLSVSNCSFVYVACILFMAIATMNEKRAQKKHLNNSRVYFVNAFPTLTYELTECNNNIDNKVTIQQF